MKKGDFFFIIQHYFLRNFDWPKPSTTQACSQEAHRRSFNYTAAVAIDISGAFDNINWAHLRAELQRYEFPTYAQLIIGSFLSGRIVSSGEACTELERGCPQGSVLGPLLWNIAYNLILVHFEDSGIPVNCYADDTALVIAANTKRRLQTKINSLLDEVAVILAKGGLSLSPQKTEVVVFCGDELNGLRLDKVIRYHVLGQKMRTVRSMKYLGVFIDETLSWDEHITFLLSKSWNMLPKIVAVATNTFGYSNSARKTMLRGTIGAYWHYCCSVFVHKLARHRVAIAQLHREMARCCGRLYKTVSYYPATVIANYPPLELDIYRTAAIQCWKRGYIWNQLPALQIDMRTYATLSLLIEDIESYLLAEWHRRYQTCGRGLWTQELIPLVGVDVGDVDFHLSQALSGHGCFREFLHRFRRWPTPLCECGMEETPDHVFRVCPRHEAGRPASLDTRQPVTITYLTGTVKKLWREESERQSWARHQ